MGNFKVSIEPRLGKHLYFAISLLAVNLLAGCAATMNGGEPTATVARENISVVIDSGKPSSSPVPEDFAGLSLEMSSIRKAYSTSAPYDYSWLDGHWGAYSQILTTMKVRHLRIGGNSAEALSTYYSSQQAPYPTIDDATRLNDFAQAIHANVLWTLPVLDRFNPSEYSIFAKKMMTDKINKGYTFSLIFAIGNEPSSNGMTSAIYQGRFVSYMNQLKSTVGDNVPLSGPSVSESTSYCTDLLKNSAVQNSIANLALVTAHHYPDGDQRSYSSVSSAIDALLSRDNDIDYSKFSTWIEKIKQKNIPTRIEETNNMSNGGKVGASDSFAAALWALDYLAYFASNTSLGGIDLHVGSQSGPGFLGAYNPIDPIGYSSTYTLRGVGYGILAFNQFAEGYSLPIEITNLRSINLSAYAILHSDGTEGLLLINRTHEGTNTQSIDAIVSVTPGEKFSHAKSMALRSKGDDLSSLDGITLGGKGVDTSGKWKGTYSDYGTFKGTYSITVPHATAVLVEFY
jgi:hypothetical protein